MSQICFTVFNSVLDSQSLNKCAEGSHPIGTLLFQYVNTNNQFKIDTDISIPDNVILQIIITLDLQLQILQVFMWKFKQEYFLKDKKITFIFIQDFSCDKMSKLWANLGGLTAHMGFEVQSVQKKANLKKDEKQQYNFEFYQDIQIYHQSQYATFDTLKLKKEKFIFSTQIENDLILYQILLTKQAVNHEEKQPHILPIILAINAISLESNIQKINQNQELEKVDLSESMILQAQDIYNNVKLVPEDFSNVFHLPIHLINIFFDNSQEINISSQIEFQQMCDVSYYNKVEYMCLTRNFNRNENSVISFSSRSGKSITMYSLYYYDLFSQKQVPVYINLIPDADDQPLYTRYSFKFDVSLLISDESGVNYFNKYYELVNKVLSSINKAARWAQNCQKQIVINDVLKSFQTEKLTIREIFNKLLELQLFRFQIIKKSNNNLQNYQQKQQVKKKKEKGDQEIKKNINLYIDECLSKQYANYKQCLINVTYKCKLFYLELHKKIQNNLIIDQIFQITEDDIVINDQDIMIKNQNINSWVQIFRYKYNENILQNITNKQEVIQQFSNQHNFIITKATKEQKIFVLLKYWHVYYKDFIQSERSQIQFIDKFIINSPQFLNIKAKKDILFHLFEKIQELSYDLFYQQLDCVIFQFFMSLYNPRCIETMFWKNIQYYLGKIDERKRRKSFNVNYELYYGKEVCSEVKNYVDIIQLNQVTKINKLIVKNIILVAGTDFSLINFVRQNQLCYSTESSRLLKDYTQTSIISPAQPHPQAIEMSYYKMQRVSLATDEILLGQIERSVQRLDFHQYYVHMLPEKASELQTLCALISPQILFQDKKIKPFLLNQSEKFSSIMTMNNKSAQLDSYQMYQYKQISDPIIIKRSQNNQNLKADKINIQNNIKTKPQEINYDNLEIYKNQQLQYNFDIKQFHKKLVFISSNIYNKEILVLFNYHISQKFFQCEDQINPEIFLDQEQKLFSWDSLNECNSILLFVLRLTGNKISNIFKIIRDQTNQSLYLSVHSVINNLLATQPTEQLWKTMQKVCFGMKFMFLQQSYDEFMHLQDPQRVDKIDDIELYLLQQKDFIINSFKILLNHGIFKLQKEISRKNEKLVIISVIDKQFINTAFPMSDYMLTIILSEDNLLDENIFQKTTFKHTQIHKKKNLNCNYFMYQIFIEYGTHVNQDLGRKIYKAQFKSIIQLGFIQKGIMLNNLQFTLQNYQIKICQKFQNIKKFSKEEYLLKDLQEASDNLSIEFMRKNFTQWIENQNYLVKYITNFQQLMGKINFSKQLLSYINLDFFANSYVEEQFLEIQQAYLQLNIPIIILNVLTQVQVKVTDLSEILDKLNNQVILNSQITDSDKLLLSVVSFDQHAEYQSFKAEYGNNEQNKMAQLLRWLNNQVQVADYINKMKTIYLDDEIIEKIDLKLFHHQRSIFLQLKKIIYDIEELKVQQIDFEFYDLYQKKRKFHHILVCNLSVSYILQSLGDYVILKFIFDQDTSRITFLVISANYDQNVKKLQQNPRKVIKFWRTNYFITNPIDKLQPLIVNYIKTFKAVKLTKDNSIKINLDLFSPSQAKYNKIMKMTQITNNQFEITQEPPQKITSMKDYNTENLQKRQKVNQSAQSLTVNQQFQYVIAKARKKAQGGEIKIKIRHKISGGTIENMTYYDSPEEVFQKFTNFVLVDFKVKKQGDITVLQLLVLTQE